MKVVEFKNGETVSIREAVKEDASRIIDYLCMVAGETDFLTFGPGEFLPTFDQEVAAIEEMRRASNKTMIVAEVDNKIIGCMSFSGGTRPRVQHTGELGISILRDYWGLGVGTDMMEYLIDWGKDSKVIRKFNLRVRDDNTRAIKLYKKLGFIEEGITTREFYINGKFFDFVRMGLCID